MAWATVCSPGSRRSWSSRHSSRLLAPITRRLQGLENLHPPLQKLCRHACCPQPRQVLRVQPSVIVQQPRQIPAHRQQFGRQTPPGQLFLQQKRQGLRRRLSPAPVPFLGSLSGPRGVAQPGHLAGKGLPRILPLPGSASSSTGFSNASSLRYAPSSSVFICNISMDCSSPGDSFKTCASSIPWVSSIAIPLPAHGSHSAVTSHVCRRLSYPASFSAKNSTSTW